MVSVHPVDGGAAARAGDHRQRRIAADAVVAVERLVIVRNVRTEPDGLRDRGAGCVIFADEAPVGIVDEAVRGRARGDADPIVEPVIGIGLAGIAAARVGEQPAVTVVARADRDAPRPRLARRIAPPVIADRARA